MLAWIAMHLSDTLALLSIKIIKHYLWQLLTHAQKGLGSGGQRFQWITNILFWASNKFLFLLASWLWFFLLGKFNKRNIDNICKTWLLPCSLSVNAWRVCLSPINTFCAHVVIFKHLKIRWDELKYVLGNESIAVFSSSNHLKRSFWYMSSS